MKLKLVKSLWGMEGTMKEKIRQIAEAGYAAVEAQVPVMINCQNSFVCSPSSGWSSWRW